MHAVAPGSAKDPARQIAQEVAATESEAWPGGQFWHIHEPGWLANVPGWQAVQVEVSLVEEKPALQAVQEVAAELLEKRPWKQDVQDDCELPDPNVPMLHGKHAVDAVSFAK